MSERNFLNETFSSILFNISDYETLLTKTTKILTQNIEQIDNKNLLSINFLDSYKNYPKYAVDFKPINSLNKYNLVTILNIAQNDINYLIESISNSNILSFKTTLDKLPDNNILDDYNLQTSFFTNLKKDFFEDTFYNGFTKDDTRRSYIYKTFGYAVPTEMKNSSFIFHFTLFNLINKNLKYSIKLFENLYQTVMVDIRDNLMYSNSFNSYIDKNSKNLATSLVKFILAYTYNITNPSGIFINKLISLVEEKILKLKSFFEDSIKNKDLLITTLALFSSESLYNNITANIVNSLGDQSLNIIDPSVIQSLTTYENSVFNEVYNKYSPQSIKDYLYLVYYYKLQPRKFLNALQMILEVYTRQNLIDYEVNEFNFSKLNSLIMKLLGTVSSPSKDGIKFNELEKILKLVITPNFILEQIEQNKIVEFSTRIGMISVFEDLFSLKNETFNEIIDEIYFVIFNHLKDTAQITPYYEFFFNRKMIFWYLFNCIKRDTLQNKIFNKEEIVLSEFFYDILTNDKYKINFEIEKMRSRSVQYMTGNINNIGNLFENMLETSIEKRLHNEHIAYFLN